MGGKTGIVDATMLCMEHQCQVEYSCLQSSEASVLTEQIKKVFGGGQLRTGISDITLYCSYISGAM